MSTKKQAPPHFRCDWDIPTVAAVQALHKGEATPEQQVLFVKWLVHQACATHGQSFSELGDRETCFAEGRRFVGNQVLKLTLLSINALRKASTHE